MSATRISTAVGFKITTGNGQVERIEAGGAEGYAQAVAYVRETLGCEVVGHDGDLEGFGDQTMCWASESEADDGVNSRARITGLYAVER